MLPLSTIVTVTSALAMVTMQTGETNALAPSGAFADTTYVPSLSKEMAAFPSLSVTAFENAVKVPSAETVPSVAPAYAFSTGL